MPGGQEREVGREEKKTTRRINKSVINNTTVHFVLVPLESSLFDDALLVITECVLHAVFSLCNLQQYE